MRKFVIWGSSGHAKVLADVIAANGDEIVALFDNDKNAASCIDGVPLYYGLDGFLNWKEARGSSETLCAALAIGGQRGEVRKSIAAVLAAQGLTFPNLVHPSAVVSPSAKLGIGCHIMANTVIAADAWIGDFSIVNNSASVDHECGLGVGVHVAPGAVLCGLVNVGDFAMIGAGAVILPRLNIGKNAMIGAGSVVTKDVPDNSTVFGNPAKPH